MHFNSEFQEILSVYTLGWHKTTLLIMNLYVTLIITFYLKDISLPQRHTKQEKKTRKTIKKFGVEL